MIFSNQFISNTLKIPSFECTRNCARPCTEHKSVTCKQVLGSDVQVKNLASFWVQNAEAMTLTYSYLLNNFASVGKFTPEEFEHYRGALMDFIAFFQLCLEESKGVDITSDNR